MPAIHVAASAIFSLSCFWILAISSWSSLVYLPFRICGGGVVRSQPGVILFPFPLQSLDTAVEVLCTLRTLLDNLAGSKVLLYPQLLLAAVALLNSSVVRVGELAMQILLQVREGNGVFFTAQCLHSSYTTCWGSELWYLWWEGSKQQRLDICTIDMTDVPTMSTAMGSIRHASPTLVPVRNGGPSCHPSTPAGRPRHTPRIPSCNLANAPSAGHALLAMAGIMYPNCCIRTWADY